MINEFDEVMSQRTDEELIRILTGPQDNYQPAALEAAKRVFDSRNIPSKQVTDVIDQIERQQHEDAILANEPLEARYKLLAFIFPKIVLFFPGIDIDGRYERKNKELLRWQFYGVAFYTAIILMIIVSELV